MQQAKIENDAVAQFPYSMGQYKKDNKNVSVKGNPSKADREALGVFDVTNAAEPGYNKNTQSIQPAALPILVSNAWELGWDTINLDTSEQTAKLTATKERILDQIHLRSEEAKVIGVTVATVAFDTDEEAVQRILVANVIVTSNRVVRATKRVLVSLNVTAFSALLSAVYVLRQDCYGNEKSLSDSVNAATTVTAAEAIDIDTGWPTNP